ADDVTYSVQAGSGIDSLADLRALPLVVDPAAAAAAGAATAGDTTGDATGGTTGETGDGEAAPPTDPRVPQAPEPVALEDVATVEVAPVEATSFSRLDGEPSLGVAITKTPDGNTVEVSHAVQDALDDLAGELSAAGVTTAV